MRNPVNAAAQEDHFPKRYRLQSATSHLRSVLTIFFPLLLVICTGTASAQQFSLTVVWTITPLAAYVNTGWTGSETLTITGQNYVFTGQATNPNAGCTVQDALSGQGSFTIPVGPTPPASFSFNTQVTINGTETFCPANSASDVSDSGPSCPVTILATPIDGGYSLSTNTVYPPQTCWGNSLVTVTASGNLSTGPQIIPPPNTSRGAGGVYQFSVGSGLSYNALLTATGGTPPYTWCVLAGSVGSACDRSQALLPAGFALSNGLISSTGTPGALPNIYPFTVQVTDSASGTATQAITLTIACSANVELNYTEPYLSLSGTPVTMFATFNVPAPNTLLNYSQACGYVNFDWTQTVIEDATGGAISEPSCLDAGGVATDQGGCSVPVTPQIPPFLDPPLGGYTYQFVPPDYPFLLRWQPDFAYANPFYYSPLDLASGCAFQITGNSSCNIPIIVGNDTLNFYDSPHNQSCSPTAPCIGFKTQLVGICGASPSSMCGSAGPSGPLFQWTWYTNFNGSVGGIYSEGPSNFLPPDPGSGTGGITITSINGVPSPPVSVDPSASTILASEPLPVSITVGQFQGEPLPAGTVTLTSGAYTSAPAGLDGNGSATITIPAGSLPAGSDMLTVAYTPSTPVSATYSQAWGTALVTVNPAAITPQIVFLPTPASQLYGTPIAAGSLDAIAQYNGNSVSGAFVYTTGACGGAGQALVAGTTVLQAGSYLITACFTPSNTEYATTSTTAQYSVTPASQTISFGPLGAQLVGATIPLNAAATSGMAVGFQSLTPAVCSVSPSTATALSPGTCTIQATQSGSVDYNSANPVQVSFPVMGFNLTAEPASETIKRGVLGVFLLEVKSVNGFAGNVNISCMGGPLDSVCGDFPQTVRVRANGTALALAGILFRPRDAEGTYTITFTGVSGADTSTATAVFTVK